jgi:hypothetical protein
LCCVFPASSPTVFVLLPVAELTFLSITNLVPTIHFQGILSQLFTHHDVSSWNPSKHQRRARAGIWRRGTSSRSCRRCLSTRGTTPSPEPHNRHEQTPSVCYQLLTWTRHGDSCPRWYYPSYSARFCKRFPPSSFALLGTSSPQLEWYPSHHRRNSHSSANTYSRPEAPWNHSTLCDQQPSLGCLDRCICHH